MSKGNGRHIAPPKLADQFLERFCKESLLEEVKGDLHEFYGIERENKSKALADLIYWYHVLQFLRPFAMRNKKRRSNRVLMISNHFKLTIRGFRKTPFFHGLNTLGLAIGIAACLLIAIFVKKEQSFDKSFSKSDRIYRIETDVLSANGQRHMVRSSPAQAPAFQRELPGISAFTRLRHGDTGDPQLVEFGEKSFFENRIFYADSTFFQLFDFPMALGNPEIALLNPNSIVLTSEAAQKYFGEQNPIGEILILDQNRRLSVTGVLAPFKENSHLDFDFLISMTSFQPPSFGGMDLWSWSTFYSYVLIDEGVDAKELEAMIPELLVKNWREDANQNLQLSLKPLESIYLNSPDDDQVLGYTSSQRYSSLLIIIGLFIFLNCAFNHVNLSTAIALNRTKEVGVRKVLGARRANLQGQFIWESIFQIVFSIVLAGFMVLAFSKTIAIQLGWQIDGISAYYPLIATMAGVIFLLLVFASSLYLTSVMSRISPSQIFKGGGLKLTAGVGLRKLLTTAQIGMSFLLLIGAFVVIHQLKFIYSKNLGFSKDQVVMLELNGEGLMNNYENLKAAFLRNSNVESVGAARLGLEGRHGSYRVFPQEGEPSAEGYQMSIYPVQYDFFETLDMKIVEGRSYSRSFPADSGYQFIINEAARGQLGFEEVIGKRIMLSGQGGMYGTVVGVVGDFHFKSLAFNLDPMVLFFRENATNFVYVKTKGDDMSAVISSLENSWKSVNPDFPFEFQFLDSRLKNNYALDQQFQGLINFFSALIVLITITGLFGMSAHAVKQRTKELAIRRVLGAKLIQLISLLSGDFTKMVGVSFLIAVPASVFTTNEWLQSFAYRSSMPWIIYLIILLGIMVITLSIIGFNTLVISKRNSVDNLRNE